MATARTTSPIVRGGRYSSRTAVDRLIADGFFAEPRTIGDVRNHLETLGHRYKAEELSGPLLRSVRSGDLDRKKNDDGLYEYHD